MSDKNRMNEDRLEKVVGGATVTTSTCKFVVGQKVTLYVYPALGVGEVKSVYNTDQGWKCQVLFDTGVIDALQEEFMAV